MADQKQANASAPAEKEGKGISITLIIVIIVLVIGGFYMMKKKDAKAPSIEIEEIATTTPEIATNVDNAVLVERATKVLASGLGISSELVKVVSSAEKEWPDGCLGLAKPEEICTQSVVSGYEIVLEAQGVSYTYRTDKAVNVIRADKSKIGK